MATLEVHDSKGRVRFVEIARDHPILFGTSSACDVVLEGEFIRPVHGRIRWKSNKFKIEASPDAEFVVINGHKMTAGSLHQGDEITVGDCRMFLIRTDDGPAEPERSKAAAGDDRTRVAAPPVVAARDSSRRGRRSAERDEPPLIERSDWLDAIRTKPGKEPGIAPVEAPLRRSSSRGRMEEHELNLENREPKPKAGGGKGIARLAGSVGVGRAWPGEDSDLSAGDRARCLTCDPGRNGVLAQVDHLLDHRDAAHSTVPSRISTTATTAPPCAISTVFCWPIPKTDAPARRTCCGRSRTFGSTSRSKAAPGRRRSRPPMRWSTRSANCRNFATSRCNLAELIIKIGEGLADRARRAPTPRPLPKPSRRSACTLESPASRRLPF